MMGMKTKSRQECQGKGLHAGDEVQIEAGMQREGLHAGNEIQLEAGKPGGKDFIQGMKSNSRQEGKRGGLHDGDEDQIEAGRPGERTSYRE
ncbi:hypothetical protein AB1K84_00250 [Mesobacillus foraminis]|uniref:hypothetical protein n=1 Tax=Mesobacillus foraminis TaxID=279826 RepID=UPI0039A2D57F